MTPLFPAQRAAEEFEKVLGGTATEAVTDRYTELLDAVEFLRAQPDLCRAQSSWATSGLV